MKSFTLSAVMLISALSTCASGLAAAADPGSSEQHVFMNSEDLKWGNPPPAMPKGAKVAVLFGDPHKPGPFAVRLLAPGGYRIPPHSHSRAESLTILSGALYIGNSETFEPSRAHPLKAGGFYYLPSGAHHFAYTEEPTVVQIQGEGPFDMEYMNAADDPRKGAK